MDNDFQVRIGLNSVDGIPVVEISGECDAFTATFTHGAMVALVDEGYRAIIVDISNLTFLDVAGFHALDDCCRKMGEVGGKMLITHPGPHVHEIYELLRERESCKTVDSVEKALEMLRGAKG